MKIRYLSKCLAALLGVSLTTAINAHAYSIPLGDPGFEAYQVNSGHSPFPVSADLAWFVPYGTFSQGSRSHASIYPNHQSVQNNNEAGMIYAEQITTNTVEAAGETITAGAWAQVSSFAAGQCDFNVVISIGGDAVDYTTFGNPVATNTLVITNSTDAPVTAPDTAANPTYAGSSGGQSGWTYFTVQYVTTAADVGQTIGVSVGSDGGYPAGTGSASLSFFDDVTLDTVVPGAPTVVSLTVSTNQVIRNGSAVITATIMPGVNDIATVTVDASLFGGSSAQTLVYSNTVDGNFVYTNTITASAPAFYDNPIPLPLTVNDVNGLTGGAGTNLVVASPPVLTWGGGNGNWTDGNWLPGGVVGPAASYSIAIVTNGVVTGNYPQSGGGIGKVSSIILVPSGTLTLSVGAIYNLSNLQFTGGTLDIFDNTEWGTYGVATLKALTASGAVTSTITNSCTTPGRGDPGPAFFNVASPSSTFTVSNGATLTVSAELRDYPSGASMLIKSGAGLLELSGTNTYTGGTTVAQGTLKVSSTIALQTNTTLTVSNGATVNLNYSGMIALGALVLDGVSQANGTYGAIGSSATYTSTNFIGLGVISVNFSSPILTWGGGAGNWTDPNWLPGDVTGPLATNGVGIVTNGVVTANIGNSSSGSDLRHISAIVLAPSGTLSVSGANLNTFTNLQFIGGTLDMTANGGYGYGSCILSAVTASGPIPSVITNSSSVAGYYTLGSSGGCTFTVSNGAVLTVSANLIDTPPYVDKEATYTNVYYYPGAVIKSGAGLLELSGANINTGGIIVQQGTLQLDSITAFQTNTPLSVAGSAIVNLNYSGTITASSLTLGGVTQASGTYGAAGSGAANINDTYFTGTGVISVPGPLTLSQLNFGNGQLQFSWDTATYPGAVLQVQTNSLSPTGWVDYSGTSPVTVPIDPTVGSVFFRMKQ